MRTGKTVDDLLQSDIQSMTAKELRQVVSQLADAANKRVRRLEKSGTDTTSPAYAAYQRAGGQKFSTKGKNLNELRAEFKRESQFLKAKTSTVKGARTHKRDVEERFEKTAKDLGYSEDDIKDFRSETEQKRFWDAYDRIREQNPNLLSRDLRGKGISDKVQAMLKMQQQQDRRLGGARLAENIIARLEDEEWWQEGRIEEEYEGEIDSPFRIGYDEDENPFV